MSASNNPNNNSNLITFELLMNRIATINHEMGINTNSDSTPQMLKKRPQEKVNDRANKNSADQAEATVSPQPPLPPKRDTSHSEAHEKHRPRDN